MIWLVDRRPARPLYKSARWGGAMVLSAILLVGCGSSGSSGGDATLSPEGQLAQHLTQTGSVMYGAYWCPHCADQKAMFGEAVDLVPYVECADDGDNAQPQLCQDKGIQGYPTWEINGELHPGTKSLADLADLSGYSGELP